MQNIPTSWLYETSLLLRNRPSHIRLRTIAASCKVSTAWLSKLQNGKLLTAPVEKVQSVNTWLKDEKNVT